MVKLAWLLAASVVALVTVGAARLSPRWRHQPAAATTPLRRTRRAFLNRMEEHLLGCRVSDFLDSYDSVTANSEFTAEWIERMWGRHPETIYSVGDDMGPPVKKEKISLTSVAL